MEQPVYVSTGRLPSEQDVPALVDEAYRAGDAYARALWGEVAELVRARFDAAVSPSSTRGLSVERAWLGGDAGVIGAAVLDAPEPTT